MLLLLMLSTGSKMSKKKLLAVESKDWNRSTSRELTIELKLSMLLCLHCGFWGVKNDAIIDLVQENSGE